MATQRFAPAEIRRNLQLIDEDEREMGDGLIMDWLQAEGPVEIDETRRSGLKLTAEGWARRKAG
jgi:hypothetical protein